MPIICTQEPKNAAQMPVSLRWPSNVAMPKAKPMAAQRLTLRTYHMKPTPSMLMNVTPAMLPMLRMDPPVPAANATSCQRGSSVGFSNMSMDASTSGTLSTIAEETPSKV
eukprot:UN2986